MLYHKVIVTPQIYFNCVRKIIAGLVNVKRITYCRCEGYFCKRPEAIKDTQVPEHRLILLGAMNINYL